MKTKNIFWLLAIWTTLITACAEKDELQSVKGVSVEVTCSLQVARIGGERSTRGTDLTAEESAIQDLTVIQFDGEGDDAPTMIVRTFQNLSSLEGLKVGLMQPQNAEKQQTLYFIANAGKTFSNFNGTLKTFKATVIPSSEMGGNILMTGSCLTVIKKETSVAATLTSRLAKIVFKLDLTSLPSGARFEPLWLQLRSVPTDASPEAPASGTVYPAQSSELYSDLEPVVSNIEKGYTWYIPENRRGKSTATVNDAKDKNNNKPDNYCTCVYLEANYYPNADNNTDAKRVNYTLYPGNNNTDNFDIEGNKSYTVNLKITGVDGKNDSRLEVKDIPASLPGANCYMVKPNSFLTFNPHNPPGADVSGTIVYLDRVGSKDKCNIARAEIVWQTKPGLIRAIYHLSASGEYRIQTANMTGNALIAAYDEENKILWSWHIWVTDYTLDDVDEKIKNISENTNQEISLTNDGKSRVFMWEKYVWMDRGIGALSNEPGFDSFGMIYQWGRKDPFLPGDQIASTALLINTITPTYDANGNRIYASGISGNGIENAISNPIFFLKNWSVDKKELWNYPNKTVFDPCPAGWCIPPSGAVADFTTKTSVTYKTNNGQLDKNAAFANNLTNLFWPYVGYRHVSSGAGYACGHLGIYWCSNFQNTEKTNVYVYGGYQNQYNDSSQGKQNYRGPNDGLLGRCVKIKTTN